MKCPHPLNFAGFLLIMLSIFDSHRVESRIKARHLCVQLEEHDWAAFNIENDRLMNECLKLYNFKTQYCMDGVEVWQDLELERLKKLNCREYYK